MKETNKLRKIFVWTLCVGIALFLLSSNFGKRRSWGALDRFVVEVCSPVYKLFRGTVKVFEEVWFGYFYLVGLREENQRLKAEVSRLTMENTRFREQLATHKRLKALLKFKETINEPTVAAQVIARDPTGWFKSIIIDKGSEAGVKVNMPVVNWQGAVGRVVDVSPDYAKVLLIIDQNSAVDCLLQRSRSRGMVKGISAKLCKLDYIAESSDVAVGDVVITSGLGGVFPKGLPVGEVVEVRDVPGALFKDVKIRPSVDFSKLEEVLVIIREEKIGKRG